MAHTQCSEMQMYYHGQTHIQTCTSGFCPHWSEVVGPIATTTQPFLPPLKQFLSPLTSPKKKILQQMYSYCVLAKSLALGKPPLRQFWAEPWYIILYTILPPVGVQLAPVPHQWWQHRDQPPSCSGSGRGSWVWWEHCPSCTHQKRCWLAL